MNTTCRMMWTAVALGLVLAVVVVVAYWDAARATFEPTFEASVSDFTAEANTDVVTDFNIPEGDFNFSDLVTFTPPDFFVASDADITDGAYVADLDSLATLGLLNNPCTNGLSVSFQMLDATTDTSATVTMSESYVDSDGNGLADGVDKYPDFLKTLFPGLTPRARMFGHTEAAATNVTMNFVIFEPGTALPDLPAFDSSWGYPAVTVLNDPTTGPTGPTPITDFCSPLTTTTTSFGLTKDNLDTAADESGEVYRTNPTADGDYTFTTFVRSMLDADGDGIENDLDTCPFVVNEGDPRVHGSGDNDKDGIDNVCDPDQQTLTDTDSDGYMNRGDNCPLDANGLDEDNQADADGDGIGDACDTTDVGGGPSSPDGEAVEKTLSSVVTIGAEATPRPTLTAAPASGQIMNCPLAGKWGIAVWDGNDAADAEQALATCGEGAVAAAYSINRETQVWSRYFAGRPEISNLSAFNNMGAAIVLGGTEATATSTPSPTPSPTATGSPTATEGTMHNCPLQGKWAIAVWDGDDGVDAEQALATCGEGAVAAAYSINRETQVWSRYFAGRPEISNLTAFVNMQGAIVLGGTEAPATPTPTPTPSPTATPTPTPTAAAAGGPPTDYLDSFHFALDMSMQMDGLEMTLASEGDFEAPDSFSCDLSETMEDVTIIDQRVVVIGDDAWIDTGAGWRETWSFDFEVLEIVGICPGSPSFWEGFSFEVAELALLPGEHETKNGEPAIHYSLAEFYEAFAGLGLIPEELEGVSIDTLDIWLAEDGYWLVSLDMEVSMEAALIEEVIGLPPGEIESISMAMSIDITGANDTRIRVSPPQVR